MDWLISVRGAIRFMEDRLWEDITLQDVADSCHISAWFLQKGFTVMTGYTITEYIRYRRLYIAGMKMRDGSGKVIDLAMDCWYDSPESFTRAFTRFHGGTPTQVRSGETSVRTFLPLKIQIIVQGGSQMECRIKNMFGMRLIGFERVFTMEEAYEAIPKYWDEICEKYADNVYAGNAPANAYEKAIVDNCIGEFGICADDIGSGRFRYLIAGRYSGGEVPEGMVLYEFPAGEWAVFDCYGPIPEALQSMNTRIFREWLPGNPDWELSGDANVEWYDTMNGEKTDANYHSAIWIPVAPKKKA